MSRRAVSPVGFAGAAARTVVLVWLRATAVVAGQIAVLTAFLWLSALTSTGGIAGVVTWLSLLGFAGWLFVAARGQYRRSGRENPTWMGYLLVAAAPFTAFGGGCAVDGACHAYLNGALLVLGYALLAVGLLLDERGFGRVTDRLLG